MRPQDRVTAEDIFEGRLETLPAVLVTQNRVFFLGKLDDLPLTETRVFLTLTEHEQK